MIAHPGELRPQPPGHPIQALQPEGRIEARLLLGRDPQRRLGEVDPLVRKRGDRREAGAGYGGRFHGHR
jgi:hypothetical protein